MTDKLKIDLEAGGGDKPASSIVPRAEKSVFGRRFDLFMSHSRAVANVIANGSARGKVTECGRQKFLQERRRPAGRATRECGQQLFGKVAVASGSGGTQGQFTSPKGPIV